MNFKSLLALVFLVFALPTELVQELRQLGAKISEKGEKHYTVSIGGGKVMSFGRTPQMKGNVHLVTVNNLDTGRSVTVSKSSLAQLDPKNPNKAIVGLFAEKETAAANEELVASSSVVTSRKERQAASKARDMKRQAARNMKQRGLTGLQEERSIEDYVASSSAANVDVAVAELAPAAALNSRQPLLRSGAMKRTSTSSASDAAEAIPAGKASDVGAASSLSAGAESAVPADQNGWIFVLPSRRNAVAVGSTPPKSFSADVVGGPASERPVSIEEITPFEPSSPGAIAPPSTPSGHSPTSSGVKGSLDKPEGKKLSNLQKGAIVVGAGAVTGAIGFAGTSAVLNHRKKEQ